MVDHTFIYIERENTKKTKSQVDLIIIVKWISKTFYKPLKQEKKRPRVHTN